MGTESAIREKITEEFSPIYLELVNESHMHGRAGDGETHFKLILVSDAFEGTTRVERQRKVYQALNEEMAGNLHALSLRTFTSSEWERLGKSIKAISPQCLGGPQS